MGQRVEGSCCIETRSRPHPRFDDKLPPAARRGNYATDLLPRHRSRSDATDLLTQSHRPRRDPRSGPETSRLKSHPVREPVDELPHPAITLDIGNKSLGAGAASAVALWRTGVVEGNARARVE